MNRYPLVLNGSALEELQETDQLPASIISGLALVATTGAYESLTGKPTALSQFTNDPGYQTATQVATTVDARVQAVVGAAPAALDTLAEIAAQLASDESAATALGAVVATKVNAAQAAAAAPVQSVQGRTGSVVVTKDDIGLGSVPNIDTQSPISFHRNRVTQNIEIPDGFNAVSYGPIEVLTGVTVRGLGNATWVGV